MNLIHLNEEIAVYVTDEVEIAGAPSRVYMLFDLAIHTPVCTSTVRFYTEERDPDSTFWWMAWIETQKCHKRQGYGGRLLAVMRSHCDRLYAAGGSPEGNEFLAAMGFNPSGQIIS